MTGLDKILSSIEDETNLLCEEIINKAKTEAENIVFQAKAKAEEDAKLIIKDAENQADCIIKRTNSLKDIKEREIILEEKRKQINNILNEAKDYLKKLPDAEYFAVILKLCKKYISPQKGEIIFSSADVKRIPRGFKTNLSKASKSLGADIKVSEKTREIDGGFVLSYGDIEENCSFDSIFESNFDLLSDKVNEILFS